MLGVHNWRPRQPGQKGLRILSLDGGGTRGVLTIALLQEVLKGFDKDVHEVCQGTRVRTELLMCSLLLYVSCVRNGGP